MLQVRHFILICLACAVVIFALNFLIPGTPLQNGSDLSTATPKQRQESQAFFTASPTDSGHSSSTSSGTPGPSPSVIPVPEPAKKSAEITILPFAPETISASTNPFSLSTTALEQRVHELINLQRTNYGLAALHFDDGLAAIAQNHSEDMATLHYFAHINPSGQDPTARSTAAGYICRKDYGSYYSFGVAENLFQNNLYSTATYFSSREPVYAWNSPEKIAKSTVAGWMNSSGHRENILTPAFDREGIGVAISSDDKVYITEDFC